VIVVDMRLLSRQCVHFHCSESGGKEQTVSSED
jgi:hypothetical protein